MALLTWSSRANDAKFHSREAHPTLGPVSTRSFLSLLNQRMARSKVAGALPTGRTPHSQITSTRHDASRSDVRFRASRRRLELILSRQKEARDFGRRNCGHRA